MPSKNFSGLNLSTVSTFIGDVFAPGLHIIYAVAWYLALEGSLVFLLEPGRTWNLDLSVIAGIVTVLLVLFYLRVIDEIKDYDYDRVYNPDRPLVRGLLTIKDLGIYLLLTAAAVIAINLFASPVLTLLVAVNLAYALFLIWLEKISSIVRNKMFVNLVVTYPVNILLSVYIYISFLERYGHSAELPGLLLVLAFVLAFLNYEFGRKTSWSPSPPPDQRLYSNEIGRIGAIILWTACAVAAFGLVVGLIQPWNASGLEAAAGWLPVLWLFPVYKGLTRFLRGMKQEPESETKTGLLTSPSLLFLMAFYILLVIHSFIVNNPAWF